jgi:hypothetical protein
MIKRFKKSISALMIGAAALAGSATYNPQPAQAGILLLPFIVGVFILVVGLDNNDPGEILLGTDGTLDRDSIASSLSKKYPTLDGQAANDLADMVKAKADATSVDSKGQKTISLSASEVQQALAPSMVEQTQPEVFGQIVADMK